VLGERDILIFRFERLPNLDKRAHQRLAAAKTKDATKELLEGTQD
jgi:hypothetical protein